MKETEIIEGLKKGDRNSFNFLFNEYQKPLLKYLYQMVGKKELAEELLHDSLLLVVKKINFYDDKKSQASFKAWIYRLTTNVAIDYLRKEKLKKRLEQTEQRHIKDISESSEQKESLLKIFEIIKDLPSIQKAVLNLRVMENLSYFEISQICGCSHSQVKQYLYKARQSIKEDLLKWERNYAE